MQGKQKESDKGHPSQKSREEACEKKIGRTKIGRYYNVESYLNRESKREREREREIDLRTNIDVNLF